MAGSALAEGAHRALSGDPFHTILGNHPLPAWVCEAATLRVLAVNDAAVRHYGHTRDAFLRLTLADLDASSAAADSGLRSHRLADGSVASMHMAASDVQFGGAAARLVTAWPAPAPADDARLALEESEQRFRRALEHAPIGMALVAPDGRWTVVNHALCRITGYTEAELLARTFQDITHPDDLESDLEQLRRLLAGDAEGYEIEKRYLRADGTVTAVLLTVAILRAADGRPLQFVSMIQDIAARREARDTLARSERRFRSLIENASDVTTLVDADGIIRFGSPSMERVLGIPPHELLGTSVVELVHPDDATTLDDALRRLSEPGASHTVELRFRHRDGGWRVLEARGSNRVDDPAVRGIIINSRDVTHRREAEDELRRVAEHLRALVRAQQEIATAGLDLPALMDGIVRRACSLAGADGAVIELMDGDEMVYRATAGTLEGALGVRLRVDASLSGLGATTGQVLYCEDTETDPRVDREASRRVGARSMVVVPLRADGGPLGVLKVVSPRPHAFGERDVNTLSLLAGVMSAAMRDALAYETRQRLLTASREAEEKLAEYAAELRRSNRELQDFAYVASHDLQEPLRKIQAFGDRLAGRAGPALDDTSRDYLARMTAAAARMQQLIQDLLAYSRASTRPAPFVPVDLGQAARDAVSDLQVRIATTGARVVVGELPVIEADAMQMRQVLLNLVGNAVKFHAPGQTPVVHVDGRIFPDVEHPGADRVIAWAEITVRDQGIGFDPRYVDRIFSPFQRLHGRDEYEGTGMGLAICRRIAERHGGTLSAQAEPGRGAAFTLRVPARRLPDPEPRP